MGESQNLPESMQELFSENVIAKVLRDPPTVYPEFVPQKGENMGKYFLRDADFWTCGFFPGILYLMRERAIKYPHAFPYRDYQENADHPITALALQQKLETLCQSWIGPIRAMRSRTDTHDMAFILQPSLRRDWELTNNYEILQDLLTGARSLATRYEPQVGAIRSWDLLNQTDVLINSMTEDFLVIIDSMMNLDLLYYASEQLSDPTLAEIATKHAQTLLKSHLRPEPIANQANSPYKGQWYSTCHVVNFSPRTGAVKERRTAQGYQASSTWARGQAWGIYGYAQTYNWTKQRDFLEAACGLTEYFLWRLESAPACVERAITQPDRTKTVGRYVPLWDFDAPIKDESNPLRDSSAGVVAANGMLLLSQSLTLLGNMTLAKRYHNAAMRIVSETIEYSLATEKSCLVTNPDNKQKIGVDDVIPSQRFDSILKNATANHNSQDHDRYSDHGLVYADYYLLEFGNRLLEMELL